MLRVLVSLFDFWPPVVVNSESALLFEALAFELLVLANTAAEFAELVRTPAAVVAEDFVHCFGYLKYYLFVGRVQDTSFVVELLLLVLKMCNNWSK